MAINLRTLNYIDNPNIVATEPVLKNAPLTNAEVDQNFVDIFNLAKGKVSKAGDTLTGKLSFAASTVGYASLNLPLGIAPTVPVNGDIWSTTAGVFYQFQGNTVEILTASPTAGAYDIDITGNSATSDQADLAFLANRALIADKLTTPRRITLQGDVAGSVNFDGSSDVAISVTVINGGGGGVGSSAVITRDEFTATQDQSTFIISGGYDLLMDKVEAYLNGVLLSPFSDYTLPNGSTLELVLPADLNDLITVIVVRTTLLTNVVDDANVMEDNTSTTAKFVGFYDMSVGQNSFKASSNLLYTPSTNTLTATDFNSTSDITKKKNIVKIENALDIVSLLNGYEFEFIDTGKKASGVIAQEIETILPHVVGNVDNVKNVSYTQIIAYLIEAVKQLNSKIKQLENN